MIRQDSGCRKIESVSLADSSAVSAQASQEDPGERHNIRYGMDMGLMSAG